MKKVFKERVFYCFLLFSLCLLIFNGLETFRGLDAAAPNDFCSTGAALGGLGHGYGDPGACHDPCELREGGRASLRSSSLYSIL